MVNDDKVWQIIKLACAALEIPGYAVYSLQKQDAHLRDDDLISNHANVDVFQLVEDE